MKILAILNVDEIQQLATKMIAILFVVVAVACVVWLCGALLQFRRNLSHEAQGRWPDEKPRSSMPVIDLRDDEDLQMERDAHEGKSLGADVDLLVAELIQIGRTDGYLSEVWKPDRDTGKNGNFNGQYKHPRAREIGEDLYKRGGMHLMEAAYYRVRAALPREARSLEIAFGGIGSWLS